MSGCVRSQDAHSGSGGKVIYAKALTAWLGDPGALVFVAGSPSAIPSAALLPSRVSGFAAVSSSGSGLVRLTKSWIARFGPSGSARTKTGDLLGYLTLEDTSSGRVVVAPGRGVGSAKLGASDLVDAFALPNSLVAFITADRSILFFDPQQGAFASHALKASSRSTKEACHGQPFNFVVSCDGDVAALYASPSGDLVIWEPVGGGYRLVREGRLSRESAKQAGMVQAAR